MCFDYGFIPLSLSSKLMLKVAIVVESGIILVQDCWTAADHDFCNISGSDLDIAKIIWIRTGLSNFNIRTTLLCSAWHVRWNSVSFTHLQLMWTTLHPLNLCKKSFYGCVGLKSQNNEIWKSGSGNLNKTVVRYRSGLFKMCLILLDSSPEIRILYASGDYVMHYAVWGVRQRKFWRCQMFCWMIGCKRNLQHKSTSISL